MEYIGIPVLLLLGLMMLFKPDLLWKIEHILSVKKGEPTDLYIAFMQIGGVILITIDICFVVYLIF